MHTDIYIYNIQDATQGKELRSKADIQPLITDNHRTLKPPAANKVDEVQG